MPDFRWTTEQAAALTSTEDTLLVANAGTGKTTTVVGKILWLLGLDVGVDAETGRPIPRCPDPCTLHEIAAVTFTEKAAYDLKRKLRQEIGRSERAEELRWEVGRASVGTIHSFCGGILREHALRLGIDPTFRVLDAQETRPELQRVMREVVLEALESDDPGVGELYRDHGMTQFDGRGGLLGLLAAALRELRWLADRHAPWCDGEHFSEARLEALCGALTAWTDGSDADAVRRCDDLFRLARSVQREWNAFLQDENARDFDALILDARALVAERAGSAAVAELRRRYRVLIVDEFQDTDRAQRDVVFAIGGAGRPQLFLVGDPKQSIYRFRGADVSVWNEVEHTLRDRGRVLPLTRNFRSAPGVIEFANAVSERAMSETAAALGGEGLGSAVPYSPLVTGRADASKGTVERVTVPKAGADDRRRAEAEHLAARILELRGRVEVQDPVSGASRPCRLSDIAVLYRTNTGIEFYERALRDWGVPYFNSQPPNLEQQQEVADLVNALRLVENARDDLRAFAWLRSPFVGLRDEVIARMRLDGGRGSLLAQARAFLGAGTWYAAPEDAAVVQLERLALERGLAALDEARRLSHRLPLDELAELLLERSGYRNHLMLLGREREGWANLDAFLRHLEAYRSHLLTSFLEIWDRRDASDPGLPQAALYSAEDDVVTLTTIHRSKGLEWPVVFLIDVSGDGGSRHRSNQLVVDPHLGPAIVPKTEGRGTRADALERRDLLGDRAEEARVIYVAVTRARERMIVIAPQEGKGYLPWLETGRALTVATRPDIESVRPASNEKHVSLKWLADVSEGDAPAGVDALEAPELRATTSATELMMKAGDVERWKMRYVRGVLPSWEFAPEGGGGGVPGQIRGTLIHGVLERIEDAAELSRILGETIGELDNPELESLLSPGTAYREALERELRRVIQSEAWRWYVEGEHWRELPFVHLEERPWRLGSFDLYRPDDGGDAYIIDFKTQKIGESEMAALAAKYQVQVSVYRGAAEVAGPARMRLHFTWPNVGVDVGKEASPR